MAFSYFGLQDGSPSVMMDYPFFEKIGFRRGNQIYLEIDISKEMPQADRVTDYEFRRIM